MEHIDMDEAERKPRPTCSGRREFIVQVSALAGGLVLSLAAAGCGGGTSEEQSSAASSKETVLKLDASSPLSQVGGSQTVETPAGKVIVAQVSKGKFVALSAVCTHNNGPVNYDKQKDDFFCPLHGSRFSTGGQPTNPPAQRPLQVLNPQVRGDELTLKA